MPSEISSETRSFPYLRRKVRLAFSNWWKGILERVGGLKLCIECKLMKRPKFKMTFDHAHYEYVCEKCSPLYLP